MTPPGFTSACSTLPCFPLAMALFQLVCFAIVAGWLFVRVRRERDQRVFLGRFVLLGIAAWMGEESCIRVYGFYEYAAGWSFFLDKVPLAILCIWPVVILSSTDLAKALLGPHAARGRLAIVVMLLVVADASLIEPIAVASGLWRWSEPGPFSVPVIGVVGWGYFALGVSWAAGRASLLLWGPGAAHALLLASWWLGLRWLPRGEDERPWVVFAFLVSLALTVLVRRRRVCIPRADIFSRVPAALVFFVLLGLFAAEQPALVVYAILFAPPYLVLTVQARPEAPRAADPKTAPGLDG